MAIKKPVVLTILDGFGISDKTEGNAVKLAKKPNIDKLMEQYSNIEIEASGIYVGLPEGQMGNSEVGHLTIGAGRTLYTGLSLINKTIADNKLGDVNAFQNVFKHVNENKSKLHIIGLMSPGGVHSHQEQIVAITKLANSSVKNVYLHLITDGRDVPPRSIKEYLGLLLKEIKDFKNVKIASISGRYWAMDRDKRWERTERAYSVLTTAFDPLLNKEVIITDLEEYINNQYNKDVNDEFIEPAIYNKDGLMTDNDGVIFANFRPDRARQLSHMLINSNYYDYKNQNPLQNIYLVSLMKYEGIECDIAFPPTTVKNTIGEIVSKHNLHQLRIAETEKYAHVTFFMDGGEEKDLPGCDKILVSSPNVATYDLQPEMSCVEVTEKLLSCLEKYDLVIINYANPDMVGHTGKLAQTIEAIEAIDQQVGRLYAIVKDLGGVMIVTADHGNAELMLDEGNNIVTQHTSNPVPLILVSQDYKLNKSFKATLANIAPTLLKLLNLPIPTEMEKPLI